MKLSELSLREYHRDLGSKSPAPGGGAATGMAASQGAALIAMVCNLTLGNEMYPEDLVKKVLAQAEKIQEEAFYLMEKDAERFSQVGKVFTMPRETQAEKEARAQAMEKALLGCTEPPMELMALSLTGLSLCQEILGNSTQHAVSDLGISALFFKSALEGAWLNVCINIAHIKDATFVQEQREQGERYLAEGIPLADLLYRSVLEQVQV